MKSLPIVLALVLSINATADPPRLDNDPAATAATLAAADTWLLPQPKEVARLDGHDFNLASCGGVRYTAPEAQAAAKELARRLSGRSVKNVTSAQGPAEKGSIFLSLGEALPAIPASDLKDLGPEGYVLHVAPDAVTVAANTPAGLLHGATTLAQAATDRHFVPALHIRDWPALAYRGLQQDICRGQVPTMDTLKRLAQVLSESKMNIYELYIEHTFKFPGAPDISPPEGLSPEEGRDLFQYAANLNIEVHPLLQVLGHSYHTLKLPAYQHLRVGPCEKTPWIMTFDIRKPEAVQFVLDRVEEICQTFPGRILAVDITEIDIDGLLATGTEQEEVTQIILDYVKKLDEAVNRHGMRLLIAQGPLDSTGHLSGMGPVLDQLPKDVIVGSYYCAGGPYQPAWEKDFPRLREAGFDFFAQAWITAHNRILPWFEDAMKFSDLEVGRGLQHGALGSTTCDWGDDGHYHLVGFEWYPAVYHGACAWTGAKLDRDYFNRAFNRQFYGLPGDSVAQALLASSRVNGSKVKVRDESGAVVERDSTHYWELTGDPFAHPDIVALADPAATGQEILDTITPAIAQLREAAATATRNRDNLVQLLFGLRNYEIMAQKLILVGHLRDTQYPQDQLTQELQSTITAYEQLREEFRRLWLNENRDNDGFKELLSRFDHTIVPLHAKLEELNK